MQQSVNKDEFFFDTFQPLFVSLKPVQMLTQNLNITAPSMATSLGTIITTITIR